MDRPEQRRKAAMEVAAQIKENIDHCFDPKEDSSRGCMAFDIVDRLDSLGLIYYLDPAAVPIAAPMPMLLTCPSCSARHLDVGEFATKPHHTHACQSCGMVWRPAIGPTVGVQFLPGFKNANPSDAEYRQVICLRGHRYSPLLAICPACLGGL